jgi:tetratricopeptide (TPR) repeat protein
MKRLALVLVVLAGFSVLPLSNPDLYAYNGKFPGKGDERDWQRAAHLSDAGINQMDAGNLRKALRLLEQAVALYPYDADFYTNIGIVYEKLGNASENKQYWNKSELFCRKALSIEPHDFNASIGLAAALINQHKFDAAAWAIEVAEKSAKSTQDRCDIRQLRLELRKAELRLKGRKHHAR